MEKGWVKLYRRTLENSFLMHDANAFLVFTKLLLYVGQEKGQWSGGRNQLGELMMMNPRTLYGVLIRLENEGMISIESKHRYSVITIKKWHLYQNKPNGGERKRATHHATLGKQGSFEDLATHSSTAMQQRDNNDATMTQHSIKNKNREKEKERGLSMDQSEGSQRASPETIARARAKLIQKLEEKKK